MRDMLPISAWWFIIDLDTRRALQHDPAAPLTSHVASQIHDAGGVLYEAHFFAGEGNPGYELLPDDSA